MSSAAKKLASLPLPNVGPSSSIPSVGYGCWKVPKDVAPGLIESVIKAGYRHIDGACDYGNEKEVSRSPKVLSAQVHQGKGLKSGSLRRWTLTLILVLCWSGHYH